MITNEQYLWLVVLILALSFVLYWVERFRKKRPALGCIKYVKVIAEKENEESSMDVLTYEIGLPVSSSKDVVRKTLTVLRDNLGDGLFVSPENIELEVGADKITIEAVQDSTVSLALYVYDDGGNQTKVSYSFVAIDEFPPELADDITVMATGERHVAGGEDAVDSDVSDVASDVVSDAISDAASDVASDVSDVEETSDVSDPEDTSIFAEQPIQVE